MNEPKSYMRILLIAVCLMLFGGLITYSVVKVRYPVSGKSISELVVTDLSLSHSIMRLSDGELVSIPGNTTAKGARRPCPT